MIAIAKRPAARLYEAGYTRIVPVIPPAVRISPRSTVKPEMAGKVPGKLGSNGWYGFSGWQKYEATPKDPAHWDSWGANTGLLADHYPGVDIDVEDETLAKVVQKFAFDHLGEAPVRRSRDSRRLLVYRTEEPFPKRILVIPYKGEEHKVEILGRGCQYLVHGAHPSGAEYRWEGTPLWDVDPGELTVITEADVEAFFAALSDALASKGVQCQVKGRGAHERGPIPPQEDLKAPSIEALEDVVGRIENTSAAYPDRDSYIAFGHAVKAAGGDDALYIFQDWAGRWEDGVNDPEIVEADWQRMHPPFRIGWEWLRRRAGDDADDIFDVDPAGVPPESPYDALSPRDRELRKLNEEYAIVQVGSKVRILQERDGQEPVFLRVEDFQLLLKHREVPSAKKAGVTQLLANAWIGWPGRREYRQVVFKPGQHDVPASEYNLWRGWPLEPSSEGSCDRFLHHLLDVVCDGDEELYEWLLDWMAHVFQYSMEKPGIVVALQGGQGAGKSIVGAVLKELLGPYQVIVDKAQHITGQFNSHLETCLFLQAEEAFWGRDKKAESTLKHLVTGERIRTERKFGDSVEMENYTRLFITSNEDTIWPAGIDDHRLVPIRVSDKRKGNHEYFDAIFAELESGGYEKLLHFFMTRKIDRDRLRVPPRTAALEAQVAESMTPHEAWLRGVLETGQIPGTVQPDGRVRVSCAALFDDYVVTVPHRAFGKSEAAFGNFVREHLRAQSDGRQFVDTDRRFHVKSTMYDVPPLVDVRAAYSARGRGAPTEWDEQDRWMDSREDFGVANEDEEAPAAGF